MINGERAVNVQISAYLTALRTAAGVAQIDSRGAELIRLGSNAMFRLPGGIVARVSRPGHQSTAAKEVAVARWLALHDVPAVAVFPDISQPILVDGRAVTFWHELPSHRSGTLRDVARLLRQLHQLPLPTDFTLPNLDPFAGISQRIENTPILTADQRAWLKGHLNDLLRQYSSVEAYEHRHVIHGDAHTGNVVTTERDTTLFLDFEKVSIGPPAWDLVSVAVLNDSTAWISDAQYREFVDSYGEDVTTWPDYKLLRAIRELRMTCYVAQLASDHSSAPEELSRRIDCLRGRQGPRPWSWSPM